jgi:hypothetical protein
MADQNQNQRGMPSRTENQANRQPQQSASGERQAGQTGMSGGQQTQFDQSAGQSGGSWGSDSDLLGRVRADMAVIGPNGEHVGTVDRVQDGRIKLTRNDSRDGQHHYLDASTVEGIEGERIRLSQAPDWDQSGESSRAM